MVRKPVAKLAPQGLHHGPAGGAQHLEVSSGHGRLQRSKVRAGDRRVVIAARIDQACFGAQCVAARGIQGLLRGRGARHVGEMPGFGQQDQLEGAQRRRLFAATQMRQGRGVGVPQRRVRVVARQQLHQQFVEIEARQQRLTTHFRHAATPLGTAQGVDVAGRLIARCAAERNVDALKRHQHRAQIRRRPLRTLGGHGHAAGLAREQIDDQARLAPVVVMQHVSRL